MPFCSLSMTLFSRSCLFQCKLCSAPHVQESQDNMDAVSVYVLKSWSYINNLRYLQEYCERILHKWTINVLVEMPTLLIGHLGRKWTREWEKLKQKSACSKKLNSSSKRPKKEPALSQTLPKQDLQSKWTKSWLTSSARALGKHSDRGTASVHWVGSKNSRRFSSSGTWVSQWKAKQWSDASYSRTWTKACCIKKDKHQKI